MSNIPEKRTIDMQVIGDWVEPNSKVLDLGCGKGELLGYLMRQKQVISTGVDLDFERITACVERGVSAYQGDMASFMAAFPEGHFDRVICSRTLHELHNPASVILEALRVGKTLTVGFVNHGFWKNRFYTLFQGKKVKNLIYPTEWDESRPANPVTIADFEAFCKRKEIKISRRVHLLGDWKSPCRLFPNLLSGYALYDLSR
ncbi:MAG: methionine biosynthesis protein MetW [Verrucomicrobiota bacterium]|jgi:methionine biosynthesis protein MetW